MKFSMPVIVAALIAGPAIAQPAPNPSTVIHGDAATAKPCEPAAPEKGLDGELVYTACQIKAIGGAVPKILSSPKEPDLTNLYKQGIQGDVLFDLVIGQNGRIRNASLNKSSRSPELDKIAVDLLNGSTFSSAADHDGKPVAVRATLPMYFWKDSMTDPKYFKKSCHEFLIDVNWRAEHFPEEKPEEYHGWLLAKGAIVISSLRAAGLSGIGQHREFPKTPAYSDVIEACKAKPERPFFDVLTSK
ncbi:energy transducer TonB [Novosphingobium colocasiae]|uniref:energy transducer TonB n=1 Tax=Novosphingobium colocasiae TaxID=1256513 RepID=UPI0035B4487E